MKKNLFYLFALICSMSLFTACSDDDDAPDYSTAIEQEMVGNYKGTLDVSVGDAPTPSIPQKISIEKAGIASVNLLISNFTFGGMPLGDIKLVNCNLQQNGKKYTCERSEEITLKDPVGKVPADVAIVIEGGKVTVALDITWNNIPVTVVYQGSRLSGSESTEAKITAFSFDMSNAANAIVIEQPIINNDNTITFRVNEAAVEADANVLKALVPTFTISDKTTSSVESGKAMDLSKDATIVLVAEDGTVVNYVVKAPTRNSLMKFSFDEWGELQFALEEGSDPINYPNPKPMDVLATSNGGVVMLHAFGSFSDWAVVEEPQGFKGKAVKLVTLDTRETLAAIMGAGVTSGSLFTGKFVMGGGNSTIEYTKFGVLYAQKPLYFKGVYKYTPGSPFIETHKEEGYKYKFIETDAIDKCAIQAVLYTITSVDETLDGTNIDSEDARIVARAQLADGSAKADWTTFNLEFKWKEGVTYDAEKTYKLAIVCSSSKDGANFNGAANSTLIVDELEVVGE